MTVTLECGACAGSGQWPTANGETIHPCHCCGGRGGFTVEVCGDLEKQLWNLWAEQTAARSAG